jgi:tetraacyldisaccharide 4'-kinase
MAWIERYWEKVTPLAALLYPLSLVFRLAVLGRKMLYRIRILQSTRLPVPVIVVGNINVGGTGKTPLVLWVAALLTGRGLHPGIVSRGYGGPGTVQCVAADSDPAVVGDEPVMLAQRCDVPIWVGRDRIAAANALLAAHPACDVIVCDDGLQHYRLARDVEVAVVDGEHALGNGWMLPAGPLREPRARLASVDAVVVNGAGSADMILHAPAVFSMALRGGTFRNLLNPDHCVAAEYFAGRNVHAIAGIGHPRRYFAHLQHLGLDFTAHPFPDHHAYTAADTAPFRNDEVVMTEKDAVKCRRFATERWWALVVDAEIDPAFGELVVRGISGPS